MRLVQIKLLLDRRDQCIVVAIRIWKVFLGKTEWNADFETLLELQNVNLSFNLHPLEDANDVVRAANELAANDEAQPAQDALQPQQMELELSETIHLLV